MNKKCTQCGKELLPAWKFCPECGNVVLNGTKFNLKLSRAEQLVFIGDQLVSSDRVDAEWDYEEAVKYYMQAAELGNATAQYELGSCYYNGFGVKSNKEEAKRWWILAAKQNHQQAISFLKDLFNISIE